MLTNMGPHVSSLLSAQRSSTRGGHSSPLWVLLGHVTVCLLAHLQSSAVIVLVPEVLGVVPRVLDHGHGHGVHLVQAGGLA